MTQTDDSRNTYDHFTEFRDEEQHLETVVRTIDVTIRHGEDRGPVYGGTPQAADIVKGLLDVGLEKVRAVRDRSYFGRIDYSSGADGGVTSIYIGDINVQHDDPRYIIVSRSAPIAGLYYRPTDGFYEIPADLNVAVPHGAWTP